jgi:phage terminase large subunit
MKNRVAVSEIRKENKNNDRVVADSAEPRTIAEFKDLGLNIIGAKKGPGSVEHGIKYLQDLEEIIIDGERCPNTAREFLNYELEKDREGNFKADFPDKNNHSIDAVRYALEDDMRMIRNRPNYSGKGAR